MRAILIILNRIIYTMGVLTIFLIIYMSTFYFLDKKIIYPYESTNLFKQHSIRPFYNKVYYPLRWIKANDWSLNEGTIKLRYGYVQKIKSSSITLLTFNNSYTSIGFVSTQNIMEKYKKIKINNYIKLTFGHTLSDENDRFINKLVEVEIIDLMDDPRIPSFKVDDKLKIIITKKMNSLSLTDKECTRLYIKNYEDKVLKHCLQAGYADDIGGGCYHIVGFSIHSGVMKKALEECNVE